MSELVFSMKYPGGVLTEIGTIQLHLCIQLMDNGRFKADIRATTKKFADNEESVQLGIEGNLEKIYRHWLVPVVPQKIGFSLDNPKWDRVKNAIVTFYIPEILKLEEQLARRPQKKIPVSKVEGPTVIFDKHGYRGVRPADPQ